MTIGFELTMRMHPLSSRYSQVTVPLIIEVKINVSWNVARNMSPGAHDGAGFAVALARSPR
jgi:hypothetical protein